MGSWKSFGATLFVISATVSAQQTASRNLLAAEGDYTIRDFHFRSGESLRALHVHYTTLGTAAKDARGRTSNAVLMLHGTTGSGHQFLTRSVAGGLFGPGQSQD